MKLDRAYQLELLNELAQCYPRHGHDMAERIQKAKEDEQEKYLSNIAYLGEHGLVESEIDFYVDGSPVFKPPRITMNGMDFIADDGGLSAILGVATIRLHGDTIKDLMYAWIDASQANLADKHQMKSALQSLPAEATKHLVMRLLDKTLEAAPSAILWLQTYLLSRAHS